MKKTLFVTTLMFVGLLSTIGNAKVITCSNSYYTMDNFTQAENDQKWTGLIGSNFVWAKILSSDVVDKCAENNIFTTVSVAGSHHGLISTKDIKIQDGYLDTEKAFKCFCKVYSNTLEQCDMQLTTPDSSDDYLSESYDYATCENGKAVVYNRETYINVKGGLSYRTKRVQDL